MQKPVTSPVNRLVSSALLLAAAACGCLSLPACSSGMKPGATSIFDLWSPPTPEEAAKWAIDPYDAEKRYRGTLLLANATFAGDPIYIKLFTDNIKDTDPGVRSAAIWGLANHGSPDHVPLIVERLKDDDAGVRESAARGLQRLHNPVAVQPLMDALDPEKEFEPAVRSQAAAALGQYKEQRVVERLITTLDDENLSINRTTRSSLTTLTGQDFGYERVSWARWNKADEEPFVAGSVYNYPVFNRPKRWWEYLPFVPPPPNEVTSTPAGLKPLGQ